MVERGQKGEAEEDVATSAEDNDTEGVTDAEHASKGQTYQEEREEQDGNGEVNATASGAGTKDDAKVNAAKNSGKPPVTILEDSTEPNGDIVWDSSGEYAGEDLQMSETGAGSDAEIMKPGKKGPKGKKRRLSSLESPPTTPPRTKTRSQTALVKRRHAEEGSSKEESSGEEWDQDRKRRALIKQRAMPPAKASVRTSSRKRNDTSEVGLPPPLARFPLTKTLQHPQRTATSMDVDDPLPRSRNSLSAGGKPRKSTKPATDAHSPRSSSAPQQKPTPVNRLYKPFLEAMGMEDD